MAEHGTLQLINRSLLPDLKPSDDHTMSQCLLATGSVSASRPRCEEGPALGRNWDYAVDLSQCVRTCVGVLQHSPPSSFVKYTHTHCIYRGRGSNIHTATVYKGKDFNRLPWPCTRPCFDSRRGERRGHRGTDRQRQ